MNKPSKKPSRLSDLPLSRLILELDAAEHAFGPASSTARTLARALRDRLRECRPVGEEPTAKKRRPPRWIAVFDEVVFRS